MSCQLRNNEDGTYTVSAPNGEESILFNQITNLPEIENEHQAVQAWIKVYTKSFKDWYGLDWEIISKTEKDKLIKAGFLDQNGEPVIFYRGDYTGLESFNYSDNVGKFGQGIYLAQNKAQAEAFASQTNRKVYPVFLKPGKFKVFKNITEFKRQAAEFNKTKYVPTIQQIKNYVDTLHSDDITIVGTGLLGKEFNTAKKENVKSIFSEGFMLTLKYFDPLLPTQTFNEDFQKTQKSESFISEMILRLQNNLGLSSEDIQLITKEDALLITNKAKNPYKDQAGFFYEGKVYLVKGKITPETVFHEFAHPLIKAISKDNNKLFNRIYQDIIQDSQGQQFLAEAISENPELDPTNEQIKEEVIVKAMTYAAKNSDMVDPVVQPSKGLIAALKKLFYAIKQILRNISKGPTKVENLSSTTTVEELANMLMNKQWNINMNIVKDSDIVAYINEHKERIEELNQRANSKESMAAYYTLLKEAGSIYRNQLQAMLESEHYDELAIVLSDETGQLDVEAIKRNIGDLVNDTSIIKKQVTRHTRLVNSKTDQEKIATKAQNEHEETLEFERRVTALSLNIITIDDQVKRIKKHIVSLAQEPDQKTAFKQLAFYVKQLKAWNEHLENFDKEANKANLETDNPVRQDINSILKNIKDTENNIEKIYENTLSETFSEIFDNLTINVTKKQEALIKEYKEKIQKGGDKKYLEKLIKEAEEEIERVQVPKEKMLKYLTGQMGDIGFLHSQFENFISSQDPSISSFAAYIKDNHTKVNGKLHNKLNSFLTELGPLLKEFGITPQQLSKFRKEFAFIDKSTRRNDKGELEDYQIYTFFNEYQNYKHTLAILNDKIQEAKDNWIDDPSTEKLLKLNELNSIKDEHIKYYFRKQYIDEYYHADDMLESTELGREAKGEIDDILSEIRDWQNVHPDATEIYEDFETVEVLWKDYKKKFSLYDDFGLKKTGDELKKAELLKENRDAKRKFHKYTIIPGAFEGALKAFEVKLVASLQHEGLQEEDPRFTEEYNRRRTLWIDRNTHTKISDEFYQVREKIYKKIANIMSHVDKGVDTSLELEAILNSLQGRRDEDGQPIGTEMTDEMLKNIKDLEQKIENSKQNVIGSSGLTKIEGAELASYYNIMAEGKLSKGQLIRFKQLKDKKTKLGLSKAQRSELFSLFGFLTTLQYSVPTDYYIDVLNNFYRNIKEASGQENPEEITHDNIDRFLQPSVLVPLFSQSPKFEKWFKDNHILKNVFDYDINDVVEVYQRTKAWSVIKPGNSKYIEKTEIYDKDGTLIETINGVPNMKFQRREVLDKYHTGYDPKTGEINKLAHYNIQGYQLPKTLEEMEMIKNKYGAELTAHNEKLATVLGQGIPYDYYINREYLNMKKENSTRFQILEKLRRFHYESQEGLDRGAVLGDEMPRQRKDKYEYLTSGTAKEDAVSKGEQIMKGITQFLGKKRDDFEEGLNAEESELLIGTDAYNEIKGSKIPIRGRYNLDLGQVSEDITSAIFTYYQSAEQNKLLKEMQPMAEAMKQLANNQPLEMNNINHGILSAAQHAINNITGRKSQNNRRKEVIDGMVEIIFEGKKLKTGHNNPTLVKMTNNALALSSHSFFAFDITSAMKNFLGAQFQIALEGAGKKYYSYSNWHRGRPWAFKAMAQISQQVYAQEAKSLDIQIIDIFDAIQGRFEEKFGESVSRSITRDTANLQWSTSHRKWLESEATLQLFSAIMHDRTVEQIQPDGTTKKLRYINAWELDPKTRSIKLKEGIDSKWDIGGKEFNKVYKENHEVSNLLQGAYAGFDQPLVTRHIMFRMVGSMRKYFTKMLLHRYGARGIGLWPTQWFHAKARYNLATSDMHLGFYWQNMITLRKIVESGFKHIMYMSPEETRALKMGALELLKLQLFTLAYFWIFGFDPGDDEKWKKLKDKSGALPTMITDDQWSENFKLGGWLENHILLLMMHVEAENEHFVPMPGYGLSDMYQVIGGEASIAAGGSYKPILDLLSTLFFVMTGNEKIYYKKDTGALNIQQEGENKFWRKFYRLGGVSGKFIDPATSLKNFYQQRERN